MNPFVKQVALELYWLQPPPVFIGGSVLGFYLDAFGRSQLRTTLDVDIIIPAVTTYHLWTQLEAQLRKNHWNPDQEGPICRYRSPTGILVDFLPKEPNILGFAGIWYEEISKTPQIVLFDDISIQIAQPAHFLATKIEAFGDRGIQDPILNHDLEDIISLIDGCADLLSSIKKQNPTMRQWIQEKMIFISKQDWFQDAVTGNLPRGPNQQQREEHLFQKWSLIIQIN